MEGIHSEILKELVTFEPNNKKIRLGNEKDGGYIILDKYEYDCFLSGGIGNNVTFEEDFIKKYPNIPNFLFDSTVDNPGNNNFNFIKKNIGDGKNSTTSLIEYDKDYDDIFIKLDIEGSEWEWINEFNNLFYKVKQIVFEAHGFFIDLLPSSQKFWANGLNDEDHNNRILNSLKILNKTHYLVHVHANNGGPMVNINNEVYPSFFELTYIRKEIKGLNKQNLPIEIDFITDINNKECDINIYPFFYK